jgi:hypothetical protein
MPTIRAQKIASVVYRLGLKKNKVEITEEMESRLGNVVAVRALGEKRVYNELELENGRMVKISRGDVIVGALGPRRALRGFVGEVPPSIHVGDTLHILNLGGVIGYSRWTHKDLGQPLVVEVLGMVLRDGRVANVKDSVIPRVESLSGLELPPIVLVSGACMNSGKTFACTQVIRELSRRGKTVHGGKLTGVACRRDSIAMEDHGAARTASFLDAGCPSTAGLDAAEMVQAARDIVGYLAEEAPDAIFIELGDGIIGDYGVMAVLELPEFRQAVKVHIFCAGDLVGAWGGHRFLSERGIPVHLFSGPCTDTPVGDEFIEKSLGVPAINARLDPERLGNKVMELLDREAPPVPPAAVRRRPAAESAKAAEKS